ncbi:MAG: hypothetical protein ACM34E_10895, partial [Acidobacteriota bacterium]
ILRKSGGVALAVTDDEIMDALQHWARVEGIFAAPEGAASLAAYRKLDRVDTSEVMIGSSCLIQEPRSSILTSSRHTTRKRLHVTFRRPAPSVEL